MIAILYWVILVLIACFHGWIGFRPNGDRVMIGGGLLLVILLVFIGLKIFPVPL